MVIISTVDCPGVKDLSFKIKRDSNISRDLCKILDQQRKPDFRRTRSRRFIPSYLDVEPGSKYYKSFVQRCYIESKIDKRKCLDDMFVSETSPPILPPCRSDPQDPLMSLYDLNILSSRNSVKDAIHYYENLHGGYTVQPLRYAIGGPGVVNMNISLFIFYYYFNILMTGFPRMMEILESHGISDWKTTWKTTYFFKAMESRGNKL